MLREFERAGQQAALVCQHGSFRGSVLHKRLSAVLFNHRLWIKEIHLTWGAVHQKLDDGLGLGLEMWPPWPEIEDMARSGNRLRTRFRGRSGAQRIRLAVKIIAEQRCQRGAIDSIRNQMEKIATGRRWHRPPQST